LGGKTIRRKKEAREVHKRSRFAQKVHGLRAKLYNAKRYKEKAIMRKTYVVMIICPPPDHDDDDASHIDVFASLAICWAS